MLFVAILLQQRSEENTMDMLQAQEQFDNAVTALDGAMVALIAATIQCDSVSNGSTSIVTDVHLNGTVDIDGNSVAFSYKKLGEFTATLTIGKVNYLADDSQLVANVDFQVDEFNESLEALDSADE